MLGRGVLATGLVVAALLGVPAAASALTGGSDRLSVDLDPGTAGGQSFYYVDTVVSCPGGDSGDVLLQGSPPPLPAGPFTIRATRRVRWTGERLTLHYRLQGVLDATNGTISSGSGSFRASVVRRRHGHAVRCRIRQGPFQIRQPASDARPAAAPPTLPLYGRTDQIVAGDGYGAVVVLPWHGRVYLHWMAATACGRGSIPDPFVNVSPAMRPSPAGAFSRHERFSIRFSNYTQRYRADTVGHFSPSGAYGRVRLRITVATHGGRVIDHCTSGWLHWYAVP